MFDTATAPAPEEVDWLDFDPGPGPQWSSYLPDGLLADTLERQSGEGSQWERLERIGAWERVVAWAQAIPAAGDGDLRRWRGEGGGSAC